MRSMYHDFVNGLRGIELKHILAEYQFAKENNLEFCYVPLNIAAMAIRAELEFETFCNIYNDTNLSEANLFRTLAKLQNQVKRLVESEEKELKELIDDGLKYAQNLNSEETSEWSEEDETEKEETEGSEDVNEKTIFELLEGEE